MCALIRFITDTGLAPDIDLPLDFVPADICAAAIRHISSPTGRPGAPIIWPAPSTPCSAPWSAGCGTAGTGSREMPFDDWVSELLRHAARDPSHPMAAFLPLFVDRDGASGLTVAEMYLEHVFPPYTRTNTEHALRGSGMAFPPVDGRLIDRNIDRLMRDGLPAEPRRPAACPRHAG